MDCSIANIDMFYGIYSILSFRYVVSIMIVIQSFIEDILTTRSTLEISILINIPKVLLQNYIIYISVTNILLHSTMLSRWKGYGKDMLFSLFDTKSFLPI